MGLAGEGCLLGENLLPPIYLRKRIIFRAAKNQQKSAKINIEHKTDFSPNPQEKKTKTFGGCLSRPIGFSNLGNTCFLNSVLQCLLHIPDFFDIFSSSCECKGLKHFPIWCISCEVQRLTQKAILNSSLPSKSRISPTGLVGNIQRISKSFRYGRQEDAHEFLCIFLDALEKQSSNLKTLTSGRFTSQILCRKCGAISDSKEPFGNISLQVSSTLEQSLERFTRSERLDEYYKCNKCSSLDTCTRKLSISTLPPLLVLHLKRFASGFSMEKISKHVQFPETLDMSPYSTTKENILYSLSGVVVHSGYSTSSGHYHACVRNQGLWYEIDDEDVRLLKNSTIFSQQAYLLFYIPQSTTGAKPIDGIKLAPLNSNAAKNCSLGDVNSRDSFIKASNQDGRIKSDIKLPVMVDASKIKQPSVLVHESLGKKRPLDLFAHTKLSTSTKTCSLFSGHKDQADIPLRMYDAEYDSGKTPKKGRKKNLMNNSFGANVDNATPMRRVYRRPNSSKISPHKLRYSSNTWHTNPISS